jgi:prophage antirepressor-like protein
MQDRIRCRDASFTPSPIRSLINPCTGDPWFVAKDVCAALEIENSRNATARLDADEKGVRLVDTLKGKQKLTIVSESGLYALILRSDKPAAKKFRKWVTSEVLPAIRKHFPVGAKEAPRHPVYLGPRSPLDL